MMTIKKVNFAIKEIVIMKETWSFLYTTCGRYTIRNTN